MSNMLRALTTFLQKKIFLSFILLATVVALFYPQSAHAEYENYKTLFTNTSGISLFKGSGQNSWAITDPSYKDGITGFRFNINLEFAPFGGEVNPLTESQLEKKWDYVSDIPAFGTNKTFLIRVCETNTSGAINEEMCHFKEVPFTEYGVLDTAGKFIGISQNVPGASSLRDGATIAFNPNTYKYPGIFEKQFGEVNGVDNPWLRKITIPLVTTTSDSAWSWFSKENDYLSRNSVRIPFKAKSLKADMWYCPERVGTEDGAIAPVSGDTIRKFGTRFCGNASYFRIGEPVDITLPTSLEEIGKQEVANNEISNTDTKVSVGARNSNLPECSVSGGYFGGGTLMGCIAQVVFYIIFRPVAWFANIVGMLFDFFVGFSINDEAYRLEFIQNGWQVVRDFANIFFIIIMVYAGFSVALGFGKYSIKNVVATLIINAIIINFSLFITRLGVDMSNIFARVFYNQMTVDTTETALGGYKPISVALISAFNPQKLMDANILTQSAPQAPKNEEEGAGQGDVNFNADGDALTQKSMAVDSSEYAAFFAIVSLSSALILFFVAKMFFSVAFIFIGRVVSLYVAMIFSPLAFLTKGDVPILGKISQINWNDWFTNYQKDLYLPPIFMFFLYIIGFLMSAGFATTLNLNAGKSYLEIFVSVAIPMVIVYLLISKAKGVAEKYSSEAAKAVTQKLEGAGKVVGGLALGGAVGLGAGALAMGGRGIGGVASWAQKNTKLGNSINQNLDKKGFGGTMARLANKTLTGAQKNSFDLRDNKLFTSNFGKLGDQFGMKFKTDNSVLGALNLNQADSKGGYSAMQKKREEKRTQELNQIATNFADDDEGKAQAKAQYEKMQEQEHSKTAEGAERDKFKSNNKDIVDRINDKDNRIFKGEAITELQAKVKSGAISGFSAADVTTLAAANKTRWENSNKLKIDEFNKIEKQFKDFKKEQEVVYGKVKDNKTLTQALRIRYLKNLQKDNSSLWNTVRAVGGAGIPVLTGDYEMQDNADMRAIEKLIKDNQKTFSTDEKKTQKLDAAIEAVNNNLTSYVERIKTADPTLYESTYKKALKKRTKEDGTEEEYYDHEKLTEYKHLEKALEDQAAEIGGEIAVIEKEMKALDGDALKAKAKEKKAKELKIKKLENAKSEIESNRKEKEKEKKEAEKKE
jgi:hypothetical protein